MSKGRGVPLLLTGLVIAVITVWAGVAWQLAGSPSELSPGTTTLPAQSSAPTARPPKLPEGEESAQPSTPKSTAPIIAAIRPKTTPLGGGEAGGLGHAAPTVVPPASAEAASPVAAERVAAAATRAFDAGDYEEGLARALEALTLEPTNTKMLRVVVTISCNYGDAAQAKAHYARLPEADRGVMETRCARYGIRLREL